MGEIGARVLTRLFQGVAVAWGVSTVTFILMVGLPGDLALQVALARYGQDLTDDQAVEYVRREAGLDRPMPLRYLAWVNSTLRLDLGRSLTSGEPVGKEILFHFTYTLKLGACALAISLLLAGPLGVAAGLNPDSRLDALSAAVSSALVSIPGFALGALLTIGLAIKLKLLPAAGFTRTSHLVLPSLTLALGLAAVSSRIIRTAVAGVKGSFFLTFASLKGLPRWRIILSHGFRNTAAPVITFLGLQLAHLLDGAVVVENLFDWPGLGKLLLDAVLSRDLPLIQGVMLLIGFMYMVVNLTADLLCLLLDPRQRMGEARL